MLFRSLRVWELRNQKIFILGIWKLLRLGGISGIRIGVIIESRNIVQFKIEGLVEDFYLVQLILRLFGNS